METFFDRLQEERKRLGLNQAEFAALGGVGRTAQINYEAGERHPTSQYLIAIAAAGADVNYILTGVRSESCNPQTVAEEMAGVLYVIESVLKREKKEILPKPKAEIVYTAFLDSTPEERRMMLKALEDGQYMLPLSVARLFKFTTD
ncbi:MAG: helix-turn-helix transcriptional regulator [Magnetococcales bacterium]|nr:helix-turn-helix transcriptional regulator [Magnetococcales bacterium]